MSRSLRLPSIGAVPISVDWGLAVIGLLFIAGLTGQVLPQFEPGSSLAARLAVATVTVFVFLCCVLAHELGHARQARKADIAVLGIVLSIYGGSAILGGHARSPRSEFTIAVGGPFANLLLAACFAGGGWLYHQVNVEIPLLFGAIVWLAGVNLLLALLNLVPVAPLDGGRVLTALLWWRMGDAERARLLAGRAGLVGGAALIVASLAALRWLPQEAVLGVLVGLFIISGARSEVAGAFVRGRLATTTAGDVMFAHPPAVSDQMLAIDLLDDFGFKTKGKVLPVTRWGLEPVGYLAVDSLYRRSEAELSWTRVTEETIPANEIDRAWTTESIETILSRLPEDSPATVAIHEPNGAVVGTIGESDLRPLFEKPDLWGRTASPDRGSFRPAGEQSALETGSTTHEQPVSP